MWAVLPTRTTSATPPLPSPEGSLWLDEGFGEGERLGGTGESLMETHDVRPENEP